MVSVFYLKSINLYLMGHVLAVLQICYSECSQCFDPKTLIVNNYESSLVPGFDPLTNSNMGMCIMVCYKFTLCRSVDWSRGENICRLNTRFSIKKESSPMMENGYIHVHLKDFPQHLKLASRCQNHPCTEDEICVRGSCVPVLEEKIYKDCWEIVKRDPGKIGQDGVYVIYPDTRREVYCDMTTDGGGWTVIQKREDGDVDFYRTWIEYRQGFGSASKNYWIGNDAINALTEDKNQELRVDLQRHNGEQAYAVYTTFYIGDENSKYILTVSGYNGTAGDSLIDFHNGMKFSTKDQDNDWSSGDCATKYHGAWWHKDCYQSNLNGQYTTSALIGYNYPVWVTFNDTFEALKRTVMMIRQKN